MKQNIEINVNVSHPAKEEPVETVETIVPEAQESVQTPVTPKSMTPLNIKTLKADKGVKIQLPNFNSIKVRLKHDEIQTQYYQHQFQFHKGTIKTVILCLFQMSLLPFQFHKGTIKT